MEHLCDERARSAGRATGRPARGEAELSQMHLTCICAAERPYMDVRAGVIRSHLCNVMDD